MRKFTKTMAAVLSLTMTLTMVTPVFAEGETNITPAQTTEVVTPTPTPAQPPKNGLFVNESKTYCYKNGKLATNLLHQYAAMRYLSYAPYSGNGIKQYLSFNATYQFDKENSVKFAVNNILNRTEEMAASRGCLLPYRDWFITYERTF